MQLAAAVNKTVQGAYMYSIVARRVSSLIPGTCHMSKCKMLNPELSECVDYSTNRERSTKLFKSLSRTGSDVAVNPGHSNTWCEKNTIITTQTSFNETDSSFSL